MKLARLTDDQLLQHWRTAEKADEVKIKAEIDRRIKAKNNKPHAKDCLCTDCTYCE